MSGSPLSLHRCSLLALSGWRLVLFFLWCNTALLGQLPTFAASIDVKEVIVGIPFEVTFTLMNAEGLQFSPPSFRDFKPYGSVSESRGMSIVNGQTTAKQSWSYTLEASRPGQFTIGAAAVSVAGKMLNTAALPVKVLAAAKTSGGQVRVPPGQDDKVFIISSLSAKNAYPGQQLIWQLTLYTRIAIDGADLISLPAFEDFYSKEKRRFDTRIQYQSIQGKKYAVKTLHEESLFPQSTGELTIGAAKVRVGIDQEGRNSFFYPPKPVTLSSQPISLTVLPLPEPIPDAFTGGVGHYDWEVKADTSILSTDDALTLFVTIKGNGDSRRFAPPKISVPATCEIFEPRILSEEEYERGSEIVHNKRLEYVILPKTPGVQLFTPTMTYFDLDSNRYCTLSAASVQFDVSAGENYRPPGVGITPLPTSAPTSTQAGSWEKLRRFFATEAFWQGALLSIFLFGLFMLFRKLKRKSPAAVQQAKVDPIPSAKQRFAQVEKLLHEGPPVPFYNALLKALQSYIATRLRLPPTQLNQAVLQAKMEERNVTPIRVQAFLSILQTCEEAVFSGQCEASKMESDWHAAQQVVTGIEQEMR